jgi:hypothetical protein
MVAQAAGEVGGDVLIAARDTQMGWMLIVCCTQVQFDDAVLQKHLQRATRCNHNLRTFTAFSREALVASDE